jgi:hypothetical protein
VLLLYYYKDRSIITLIIIRLIISVDGIFVLLFCDSWLYALLAPSLIENTCHR